MKRLLLFTVIASAILAASTSSVAGQDSAFEAFVSKAADSRVSLSFSYSIGRGKGALSGKGRAICQRGAYVFHTDEFDVYNNLKEMWTVNKAAKEAVVEPALNIDFISDPSLLLVLFGQNPDTSSLSSSCSPDGKLRSVEMTLKDGSAVEITVLSLELEPCGGLEVFSFDPDSLDKGYVVTDLR